METIAVSKFKATCLAVLEQVRRTGVPIVVTKRGVPIAQVLPPPPPDQRGGFGSMRGTAIEIGDIVEPVGSLEDWEAAR